MEVKFSIGLREPILGSGIKHILDRKTGFTASNVCDDLSSLLIDIQSNNSNFVILDGDLKSLNIKRDIEQIRLINPAIKIALLSESAGTVLANNYLNHGFDGLLLTCCSEDEIIKAIEQILNGTTFICSSIKRFQQQQTEKLKELHISEREIEVIKELSYGYSSKVISENLNLSYHTVVTHRKNIFKKFEVNSALELVRKIADLNLHLFS